MSKSIASDRGLFPALIGDGTPLIKLTGVCLIGSGLFAIFLGIRSEFLPQDLAFLCTTPEKLAAIADNRLVLFMMHDRVSFGGAIIAVGILYLWLAEFPLKGREPWAWWTLLVSGALGFGSFLAYLGYGYLDTWHGAATLVLLPMYGLGMYRAIDLFPLLPGPRVLFQRHNPDSAEISKNHPSIDGQTATQGVGAKRFRLGRRLLLLTAGCMTLGGAIIMTVGMTTVFVPQDLAYLQLAVEALDAENERLIPLIAHDRAGFGGGVACCGVTMLCCVFHGRQWKSLWQTLALVGLFGFGTAIGVHYPIGYTDPIHLAPAYLGAGLFLSGMAFSYSAAFGNKGQAST